MSTSAKRRRENTMRRRAHRGMAQETHGRLGDEAKEQIRILADEACSHTSVQRSAWNLNTELRVATVKGNALVLQS